MLLKFNIWNELLLHKYPPIVEKISYNANEIPTKINPSQTHFGTTTTTYENIESTRSPLSSANIVKIKEWE